MKRNSKLYVYVIALAIALTLLLSANALASDSSRTITVYPINVLVNGEVFRPRDVNGNEVMVFTYNGTTYAPLRALAKAYGLEVGYDQRTNTATVTSPGRSAAPSFSSQWTVTEKPVTNYGSEKIFMAEYSGAMGMDEFKAWWKSMDLSTIRAEAEMMAAQAKMLAPGYTVTMYFSYGQYNLGSAYAVEGYEGSNFDVAGAWIK